MPRRTYQIATYPLHSLQLLRLNQPLATSPCPDSPEKPGSGGSASLGCDRPSPSPPDRASPTPPIDAHPLPRKPARFGRRSTPPVNVTQLMRLAGGLGLAAALSHADSYTDPLGNDWEVPSERAGGESRRAGNKRKAAQITRSAAEDFALLTARTTSEHHAADFLSTVANVIHLSWNE